MRLFLIRHAQAGDRTDGVRDAFRPLAPKGHRRAEELAALLADQGVTRVLSSPATRCLQTVAPLARTMGLDVEEQAALWEGSPVDHVLSLFETMSGPAGARLTAVKPVVAACSHGDIIPEVVDSLHRSGVPITGRGCEKGSIWVLDHDGRHWISAVYMPRSQSRIPPDPDVTG